MENGLIVVRQLPVIEEQLKNVQAQIKERVSAALSLACTEDTYKTVKEARSQLNKEYSELERRRKEVKADVLAPYEAFERVYKECVGSVYAEADVQLKAKITEVENGLKAKREEELATYFNEYRQSLGIDSDLAPLSRAGIKVTLTESKRSLHGKAKQFLDAIADSLALIDTQEHKDEIFVEFRKTLNAARAITTVSERYKAIAAEQQRREVRDSVRAAECKTAEIIEEAASEAEVIERPVIIQTPEPEDDAQVYSTEFKVSGTLDQLRALKSFLNEGGYEYEQLS